MVFMSIGKCAYRVRAWPWFWRYRDCGKPAFWSFPYAEVLRRPLCEKHAIPPPYPWMRTTTTTETDAERQGESDAS